MRRLLLALAVCFVLAPAAAWAAAPSGTINLHLSVPLGTGLTGTTMRLEDPPSANTLTLDLISGPGPFVIAGVPPGSYAAFLTSQRFGGGVCIGSNTQVPVVANATTIMFASLTCTATAPTPVPGLGRYARLLGVLVLIAGAIAARTGGRRSA